MFKIVLIVFVLAAVAMAGAAYKYGFILNPTPTTPPPEKSVYEFTMRDIDGKDVKLADYKGKVVKKEYWGLMNLAYKVKKSKKGHYVLLGLDTAPDCINELNRQYKLSEDVIRNLTVRVENISAEPSPLFKKSVPVKRISNEEN